VEKGEHTKDEASRSRWILNLIIGATLVNCVLTPVVFWFVLKWFWPGLRMWHYVLLWLCLVALVALVHWFEVRRRLKSHRAFVRRVIGFSEEFARYHNLLLEKKEASGAVGFRFSHPEGGRGTITFQNWHREKPMVFAHWQYADYDTCVDGHKEEMKQLASLEEKYLRGVLTETLQQMLSWHNEDLILAKASLDWKEALTREEFDRIYSKYPFPKCD
jgi:hypothetical protein